MSYPTYPKTPRFNMGCLVTEKIDGTNALIQIDAGPEPNGSVVRAGSRKRWLTPEKDNFGFAAFVHANRQWLAENLGEGLHYGEWYGSGIQRGYGLDHKRLALFDGPGRYPWALDEDRINTPDEPEIPPTRYVDLEGGSVGVVPLVYQGGLDEILPLLDYDLDHARKWLGLQESRAVPGFENTEGVIVSLRGSGGGQRFKIVWSKR